jgi:hypothetical protein
MLPLCAYLSRYESCPTRKRIFAHESEGRERDGAYLGRKRNQVLANWSQGNNPGVPPPPSSSGTCSCRTTCSAPSRSPRYATEYSRRRIQTMPSPAPCPAAAEHAPCHRWPPRPSAVVARAPLFLRRSRRDERSGRRLGAGVGRRRRERERGDTGSDIFTNRDLGFTAGHGRDADGVCKTDVVIMLDRSLKHRPRTHMGPTVMESSR